MKALLKLFLILIGYTHLSAQDSTFVTIKAGNKIKDVLTQADIFYYPQFTNGKVFFMDGTKGGGMMNYNRLVDQMLFIDPQGDTLALADERTIKYVTIGQDTFYYNEGYLRLIADNGVIKLAERQIWVVADVRRMGTHNTPKNTVAITTVSNYTDARAKSYDLLLNEDIVIRKESQYFFGDKFNNFSRSSKKKLLLLLPKEEWRVENYLKENKVNFDKKDDLEKLSRFLSQRN